MFETEGGIQPVVEGGRNNTRRYLVGHSRPKGLQMLLRTLTPAGRQPVGEHNGIDASGAGGGDTIET